MDEKKLDAEKLYQSYKNATDEEIERVRAWVRNLIDGGREHPNLGGVMPPRRVEFDLERLIEPRRQQGCMQNRGSALAVCVDPFDDRPCHSDQIRGNAAVHSNPSD